MMMQDQDQHLDAMGGTLVNLKEIAGTMNREVEDHVV
jgi:syntaxin 6